MFDPNLPQAGTEMDAVQMRGQLNGLKALIDAIGSITAAQVDAVNTLPPGEPAAVSASVSGGVLHLTFDIPQGNDGTQGEPGPPGGDGPQGPPFASAVVDDVFTVPSGQPATVGVSFDGTQVHFTFEIPSGQDGADGEPGEVSTLQLEDAIAGTSANSNGVGTLGLSITDPPTAWELQQVADKLDELINNLRR